MLAEKRERVPEGLVGSAVDGEGGPDEGAPVVGGDGRGGEDETPSAVGAGLGDEVRHEGNGGKAKKTSRWQREQAGQVEAFQLGEVKASTDSALGSG